MGGVYFKLNFRDGKDPDPKPASGKTALDAFKRAFEVGLREEGLGPRITSVNGRECDAYHYFILDPKTGKRYVPYKRTWHGKKKYLDLRHIMLTPEMEGMVIEITLINSQKDNRHSVVRRFDGVFSSFNLEEIPNLDMACSMCGIYAPRQILRAREADGAMWVLMLRRQALLFGGFPNRKLIWGPEVSYAPPSVKFNHNPSSPAQQGALQPLLPSQEPPASSSWHAAEPSAELTPLNLPGPSSPKSGRRLPWRFLQETQAQSDAIAAGEKEKNAGELPPIQPPESRMPAMMPKIGPIIFQAEEKTSASLAQQGPMAVPDAPIVQQTLQAAARNEYYAARGIKPAAMPKEKTRKAGAKQEKYRQPGEAKRSSFRPASNPAFVPLSSIKKLMAAIFDFDGVVVDSMELHRRSFNALLAPLGIRIGKKEFMKSCSGIPAEEILARLFKKNGMREDAKQWAKKRNGIYGRYLYDAKLQPIAGFLDFYDMLVANGVKVAVASSGEGQHIHAALESIGVRGVPVISIQHVGRGKPAPDLFLLAAKRLKVKRGQVVVFEDAPSGLAAAKRAKMPAIALSTSLPAKSLRGKAGLIIKDFRSKKLGQLVSSLLGRR